MGGWDRNASWNRDVLERIVALLFALAELADLAAGAPHRRRRHVLEILGHGEAEARAFILGVAAGAPDTPERAGDAAWLAARLRALALMLTVLLERWSALPGGEAGPQKGRETPAKRMGCPGAVPAPDTS